MNDKLNHLYIAGTGTPQLAHGLSVKLAHARVAIVVAAPADKLSSQTHFRK